jgi:tetratricopeptide (TPR) repeat protein
LGHVLHQQGNLAGAAQCYEKVLAIAPRYVSAHHSLGVVRDEQGQQIAAIHHYHQAIALDPSSIKAYNNLGCSLAKLDRRDEAISTYQQAIALQPDWAILHNNLGQVLFEQNPAAAIASYRRAIELQPDLILAHCNLGRALQAQAQHEGAIASFQQAIELSDQQSDAPDHVLAAMAFSDGSLSWIALNQWDRGLEWWRRAIAPDTALVKAYCNWAIQLQGLDELSQARRNCAHFLQALLQAESASLPDRPSIQASLAKTYFHLGNTLAAYGGTAQYRQAEAFYQQALKLQSISSELRQELCLKLAECLIKQERFSAALLVHQFVLDLDPHQLHETHCSSSNTLTYSSDHPTDVIPTTQDWFNSNSHSGNRYISLSTPQPLLPAPAPSSCAGLNCAPCLKRIFDRFHLTHLGNGIHTCGAPIASTNVTLPLFTAIIASGKAWAMPQQNSWKICNAIAILTPDHKLLSDLSQNYPGRLPGCQSFNPASHHIFSAELAPLEQIPGRVAALAGLSGHNYFHWMVDILPRLELLRQSGIEWEAIDKFWINSAIQPFQQQTLETLGIPLDKILASDHHSYIQTDLLIAPSFTGHLGWIEPWALEFLRREFLPIAAAKTALPKRIYISRAQANHRRVLNETAVMQQLSHLGFVSVTLETFSFAEQVALFAQAEVIIAPHGGGLTNMLFCSPGTTIVELVAPSYIRHYYWVISDRLKLHHYLLAAPGVACYPIRQLMYPSPLTEDIWVDLAALKILLRQLNLS